MVLRQSRSRSWSRSAISYVYMARLVARTPNGYGGSNWKGYCNPKVTNALKASDAALNPKARIKLVNAADAQLAKDVPTIPLYQKPTYFVFKTSLKGLVDNPTLQGPTWNTESWKAG